MANQNVKLLMGYFCDKLQAICFMGLYIFLEVGKVPYLAAILDFFLKKCVLINELVYNKISVYGTAASFLLKCIFSQFCIL